LIDRVRWLVAAISEREEMFQDLTLPVKDKRSILDSLHDFSIAEELSGANQYACSKCNINVDARRWESIRKIPPILIFSLSRFEYDWERVCPSTVVHAKSLDREPTLTMHALVQEQRTKNSNRFHYPLVLDLAPFVESSIPDGGRDVATTEANTQEQEQEQEQEQQTTTTHAHDNDDGHTLYEPQQALDSPELYELFAVIIHVGSSGEFGHYHAYIRQIACDHEGDASNWFDFDDSSVSLIPESKLMSQFGGRNECACMYTCLLARLHVALTNTTY
jgi:ubiquitin C-terminal hydrolase